MADDQQASLIGKLVGRYRIEKRLGSGGMGEVYLARQLEIGSRVAIKVMAKGRKTDSEGAKRMFAEARAVNLVQHDRIVNVLDMTRIDGRPALIMEHLRGVSLDRLLASGPLPPRSIVELSIDILDALDAVHAQEIFHRDLKPGNVFVSPEGRATLLDFGLAKMADDLLGTVIQTQVGIVMGTVPYMAPEQARGEPFTAASDLYAVGLLLYEGATAKRPFRGHSIPELMREHEQGPARPQRVDASVPETLDNFIMDALATDPSDRFPSAGAMKLALMELASQLPQASLRKRIDRFREASAVFVGVQPEFSNLVTKPDKRPSKPPKREAPQAADDLPHTSPRSVSRLWMIAAIGSSAVAVAAIVMAALFWSTLRDRDAELAAPPVSESPPAASGLPSIHEWSLEAPATEVSTKPIPERPPTQPPKRPSTQPPKRPTTQPKPTAPRQELNGDLKDPFGQSRNERAEEYLAEAKRAMTRSPDDARRAVHRAVALGGRGDRFFSVLAEAQCRSKKLASFRAALGKLSEPARKRAQRTCERLWPAAFSIE